jgi:hypothetical protein
MNRSLTAFSWGFWGWGTATRELAAGFDAAEKAEGFNPPVFVDIRFKRSGRAPGFQGNAFGDLLGHRRYHWMPSLGNSSIGTSRALKIACPLAAHQLLDLALAAHDRSARIVFFCACELPWQAAECHRHTVSLLLRRVARSRQTPITVCEWPGGRPSSRFRTIHVTRDVLAAVARGAMTIPLDLKRVPVKWARLPWGTMVTLKSGQEELPVALGPAAYRRGQWVLPVFRDIDGSTVHDAAKARRRAVILRNRLDLG